MKLRIGFDLDGVYHGFIERCNVIRRMWGEAEFTPGVWHFYRLVGMTDEDWVAWCNKAADAGLLFGGEPLEGAVDVMARCKELGHTVVIITDRTFGTSPMVSQLLTVANLTDYEVPYDELHFDRDKTAYSVDMMVEDKKENYDALIAAGVDAYLINRPWNETKGGDMRNRINTIQEYQHAVERVTDLGYADLAFV